MKWKASVDATGWLNSQSKIINRALDLADAEAMDLADRIADRARRSDAFEDKTGRLRRSIQARRVSAPRGQGEGDLIIVQARAPHAHLVEFGHDIVSRAGRKLGTVPAHPFLRPAVEAELAEYAFTGAADIGGRGVGF